MPYSTQIPARNRALSVIFGQMADCYRYLGNEERFRAIAYDNVAKTLLNMKEDIVVYNDNLPALDNIRGIGESIAEKIIEFLHTGKVHAFEELKQRVPFELLELMHVNGIGAATLRILHDSLGIRNKEDLISALQSKQLEKVKGFGQKKTENLQRALKLYKEGKRMLLKDALNIGNELLSSIQKIPGVDRAALAGSLRRKKDTIGDIDMVIEAEPKKRRRIIEQFIQLPAIKRVLVKGPTKVSVLLNKADVQVDCRLVSKDEYGAALLYFTGNKEHNIRLRTMARARGYKINEYGIFHLKTHRKMAGATEEEMYAFLQMKFIPPEQRLNKGEIEKAMIRK
ncbi:MAG: type-X family DNA polymerase [Sediminibacterium sp.]|nr:type-X family DNA polymerase [Sediminibacterium sp.]